MPLLLQLPYAEEAGAGCDLILFETEQAGNYSRGFNEGARWNQFPDSALDVLDCSTRNYRNATGSESLRLIVGEIAICAEEFEIGRPELLPEMIH